MQAIIKQATTAATQSGPSRSVWKLTYQPNYRDIYIEDKMGWTASQDTQKLVSLEFHSQEAAINYANKHNIDYKLVSQPKKHVKPKSYANNFK